MCPPNFGDLDTKCNRIPPTFVTVIWSRRRQRVTSDALELFIGCQVLPRPTLEASELKGYEEWMQKKSECNCGGDKVRQERDEKVLGKGRDSMSSPHVVTSNLSAVFAPMIIGCV